MIFSTMLNMNNITSVYTHLNQCTRIFIFIFKYSIFGIIYIPFHICRGRPKSVSTKWNFVFELEILWFIGAKCPKVFGGSIFIGAASTHVKLMLTWITKCLLMRMFRCDILLSCICYIHRHISNGANILTHQTSGYMIKNGQFHIKRSMFVDATMRSMDKLVQPVYDRFDRIPGWVWSHVKQI